MEDEKEIVPYSGKITPEFRQKALRMYDKYKADKEELHRRIIDNNRWYKAQYGKIINPKSNETEPATAFIFSAVENKYADAIDNFPVPNLLEREPSDTNTAKILSKIIPVQLEMSDFKSVYKSNWRRKLKHGTGIYGVFYNELIEDIEIREIDIMNVYCDMHVKDVQDSQFLFIANVVDNDILKNEYPQYKALFHGNASVETYSGRYEIEDRTEVIDCYYKKADGTMHIIKFVGRNIIDATEDNAGYEDGLYKHGMYPVIFDTLYPEEDCPFGFGVVDVIRNPQQYIDKLDSVIIKNAVLSGKQRYIVRSDGLLDEKELCDITKDIVHTSGNLDETHIRSLQANSLPHFIIDYRNEKINNLKEVIGNRDFQQGGTTGSVNAASAITALQQAGEKLSRAIIDDSYDVYKSIVIMTIDLMREFYDEERVYRITNDNGSSEFARFDNSMLYNEVVKRDALGFVIDTEYKRCEYDIEVIPQRENPFSKESNNQTIMNLWNSGFFLPQNFDVSLIALQSMNFDGKEKIVEQLSELKRKQEEQAMQMQQQAMQQEQQDGLVPVGQYGNNEQSGDDELVNVGQYNVNEEGM